jgi:hypothetical protein
LPMTGQVFRVLVREDLNTRRNPRRFLANGLCAGAPNPQVFVRSHDSPCGATHVSHVGDACRNEAQSLQTTPGRSCFSARLGSRRTDGA